MRTLEERFADDPRFMTSVTNVLIEMLRAITIMFSAIQNSSSRLMLVRRPATITDRFFAAIASMYSPIATNIN